MKKSVSVARAVVLSAGSMRPSRGKSPLSRTDADEKDTVMVLIDPVILNLEEDGPAGVVNPREVKYVA
jgi:hypothetical protein